MTRRYSHLVRAVRMLAPLMSARRRARSARSTAIRRNWRRAAPWCLNRNIVGIVVSRKTSGESRQRGELCLKFLVRRKVSSSRLRDDQVIPPSLKLEGIAKEFLTDVEQCDTIPRAQAPRVRPVAPGCSVGNSLSNGGTLGLVVSRGGVEFYLSCAHVFAPGGVPGADPNGPIEQPSDPFGDLEEDVIGTLEEFTDVRLGKMDAALARPNLVARTRAVVGIGVPSDFLDQDAADFTDPSLVLLRSSARSGLQEGNVEGFGSVNLFYQDLGEVVTLNNVVLYSAPNEGGDSGAPVFVKGTTTVAGLHVGAVASDRSICFPIKAVLDQLRIGL